MGSEALRTRRQSEGGYWTRGPNLMGNFSLRYFERFSLEVTHMTHGSLKIRVRLALIHSRPRHVVRRRSDAFARHSTVQLSPLTMRSQHSPPSRD
jgi:hypothetical protein